MNSKALLVIVVVQVCFMQTMQNADASKGSRPNATQTTNELAKDIQRLENAFTSTYDKYTTLMHAKTVHNITTSQELKKVLETFDKRGLDLDTRYKRSGACATICIHRCLPSCNLACCVERPIGINRHIINKMEVEAAKNMVTGSRKSIVGTKEQKYLPKEDMEKGICDPKCVIHCAPSCKFKCCIRVPRG